MTGESLCPGNPARQGPEPPLEFAEEEVGSLPKILHEHGSKRQGGHRVLDEKEDLSGIGMIHIAAHGRFNASEP